MYVEATFNKVLFLPAKCYQIYYALHIYVVIYVLISIYIFIVSFQFGLPLSATSVPAQPQKPNAKWMSSLNVFSRFTYVTFHSSVK